MNTFLLDKVSGRFLCVVSYHQHTKQNKSAKRRASDALELITININA